MAAIVHAPNIQLVRSPSSFCTTPSITTRVLDFGIPLQTASYFLLTKQGCEIRILAVDNVEVNAHTTYWCLRLKRNQESLRIKHWGKMFPNQSYKSPHNIFALVNNHPQQSSKIAVSLAWIFQRIFCNMIFQSEFSTLNLKQTKEREQKGSRELFLL